MSEQVEYSAADDAQERTPVERTGNEVVDEVLGSLDGIEGRPLAEQVTVFEAAHERLRGVLTGAGDASGASRPGPH